MARIFSLLLLLGLSLLPLSHALAQTDPLAHFEEIFAKTDRSYGLMPGFEAHADKWIGFNTPEGTAFLCEQLVTNRNNHRRTLCYYLLDSSTTAKEPIAKYIMEQAEIHAAQDGRKLAQRLALLGDVHVQDVPGLVPFWAKFLNDQRSVEEKPRHPESQIGMMTRVCDVAKGCLYRWLHKRKLLFDGDPAMGDTGGEMTWVARNRQIARINEILLQNKLITTAVHPDDPPPPPSPEIAPTPGSKDAVPATARKQTEGKELPDRSWIWYTIAVVVVIVAGFFYKRTRQPR